MMQLMGFPTIRIKWMKQCIETTSISILVNSSPTREFQMQKGFRQGSPITPFLFLGVAEGLTRLMRMVIKNNLFKGVEVGSQGLRVDCPSVGR